MHRPQKCSLIMIPAVLIVALALLAWTAAGTTGGGEPASDRLIEFKGRSIDLKPYIEGFPYRSFNPFYDAGKIYYYHMGETTMLKELDLDGDVDLRKGKLVSDIDFSKRNVWGFRYRKTDQNLYWSGDEINDEVMNLYSLDPRTKEVKKLTDVPYMFGWRWDNKKEIIAYVARLGVKEDRLGELRTLDLDTGQENAVVQDSPEFRFTWGSPSWHPDGKGVVLPVLKDAHRAWGNLAYVDFETKGIKVITDPAVRRSSPSALREWLNNDEFLYLSNEDGYRNLYKYNLNKGTTEQVTCFERDLGGIETLTIEKQKYLFGVLSSPVENEIVLIDPKSSSVVNREKVDVNVSPLDSEKNKLLVYNTSAVSKFRIAEVTVKTDDFSFETKVGLPEGLEAKILQAEVERIEFPTFDVDENTGKTRMLHAFLYKPKNPLPKDQQIVMIQSFYGGGNYYSTRTHILAEAGIYVLSPSPRGCGGFGREFSALNDKDLGGNEIVDVFYAADYVSKKLGIPPERVGVYGGSHGGYATMRCLTFPGEINGNTVDFNWGFGISHAGFSDIIHFYEHCNIPDWVILEAGDPKTETDKLRDRSPLYHADKMKGKLLLTHGTNDSRVPIEGSRWMADSLRTYGKDFTLVEFEGQGHGVKGLENNVKYYRVWFEFLESLD